MVQRRRPYVSARYLGVCTLQVKNIGKSAPDRLARCSSSFFQSVYAPSWIVVASGDRAQVQLGDMDDFQMFSRSVVWYDRLAPIPTLLLL